MSGFPTRPAGGGAGGSSSSGGGFNRGGSGGGGRGGFDRDRREDKDGLRVNRAIRVPQVRVIDETGAMLGVMATQEAIRIAEERSLDLMEVSPNSAPPTCKLGDYGKWKYENKKKTVAARKKQIIVLTKELQLRPRTDKHDFDTKMNHAKRFLLDGDKVKVNMRFSGREMAHQEVGLDLMRKVIETLNDLCLVETSPRTEGRQAFLIVAPDPMKVKDYKKKHNIVDKKPEDHEDHDEDGEATDSKVEAKTEAKAEVKKAP